MSFRHLQAHQILLQTQDGSVAHDRSLDPPAASSLGAVTIGRRCLMPRMDAHAPSIEKAVPTHRAALKPSTKMVGDV